MRSPSIDIIVRLVTTRTTPASTIQGSAGPGPVLAREVGALVVAAAAGTGAGEAPETAAVAGAAARAGGAAGAGAGVIEAGAAVVGVEGAVDPVVGAGADVVGVDGAAATWTTLKPPTLFPVTAPGVVSPTKV